MKSVIGVCCGKINGEEIAGLKGNHGVIAISTVSGNSTNISIVEPYCSP